MKQKKFTARDQALKTSAFAVALCAVVGGVQGGVLSLMEVVLWALIGVMGGFFPTLYIAYTISSFWPPDQKDDVMEISSQIVISLCGLIGAIIGLGRVCGSSFPEGWY